MPDNDSMLKLLNTQSQVSITERSDALREENPHPSFSIPFFFSNMLLWKISNMQRSWWNMQRNLLCSEHWYAHHWDSAFANILLYFLYPVSIHQCTLFSMHFKISCICYYISTMGYFYVHCWRGITRRVWNVFILRME